MQMYCTEKSTCDIAGTFRRHTQSFVLIRRPGNYAPLVTPRYAPGAIVPPKRMKVTIFTMILYNEENSIRDIRPFYRPLLRSILHLSCSGDTVM